MTSATVRILPDPRCAAVMATFDALPFRLRQAIASGAYPVPPRLAARLLQRGVSAERVEVAITRADRRLARIGGGA